MLKTIFQKKQWTFWVENIFYIMQTLEKKSVQ